MSTPPSEHRRLAFVEASVSATDAGLVLVDDAGATYVLSIDSIVADAIRTLPVRTPRREHEVASDEPQPIGPREIQALIRAGLTAADVAQRHDLDLARVERYEGPVLAERAWIADRARATELRRADASPSLNDVVIARLIARGDDLASVEWDAWRRDDHRWIVQATWLALGTQVGDDTMASARWVFDPVGHTVVPDDAAARALVEEEKPPLTRAVKPAVRTGGDPYEVPAQEPFASADDTDTDDLTAIARAADVTPATREVPAPQEAPGWTPVVVDGGKQESQPTPEVVTAVPAEPANTTSPSAIAADTSSADEQLGMWDSGSDEFDGVDEPVQVSDSLNTSADEIDEPGTAAAPAAVTPAADVSPAAAPKRKNAKGRAHIPTWDEILLGTQTREPS